MFALLLLSFAYNNVHAANNMKWSAPEIGTACDGRLVRVTIVGSVSPVKVRRASITPC